MIITVTFYLLIYWSFPLSVKLINYMILFHRLENCKLSTMALPKPCLGDTPGLLGLGNTPPPPPKKSLHQLLHPDTTSALVQVHPSSWWRYPAVSWLHLPPPVATPAASLRYPSLTLVLALSHPDATPASPYLYTCTTCRYRSPTHPGFTTASPGRQ